MVTYPDLISGRVKPGKNIAIMGAGGIGFDVASFLMSPSSPPSLDVEKFLKHWGIGGRAVDHESSGRKVYLLQRKDEALGKRLGKTTGWIHRLELKNYGVEMLAGVEYGSMTPDGFEISVKGKKRVLPVDQVVICAGQTSNRALEAALQGTGKPVYWIGGSRIAGELDAKRAIDEGTRLAAQIENMVQ